jgi:hypothetical protein
MRLAYIISAYKLPDQLVDLIKSINNKKAFIIVHIDKRTQNNYVDYVINELKEFDNIVFLKRHKCYWGDYGHVKATIKAIRYLVENKIKFDYFNVITGQDYPIKSQEYIEKFFKNKNKSYMEYFSLPTKKWKNGMDRIELLHFQFGPRRVIVPREISKLIRSNFHKLNVYNQKNFKFYGGSGYFSLSEKHTKFIYDFLNKNRDYEKFFKTTFISDEIFFQTILLNSKYNKEIINNNLRLIDWNGPIDFPKIFTSKDLVEIKRSKAIFARKFDISRDKNILKMIKNNVHE